MNIRLVMLCLVLFITVQLRGMLFQKYEKPGSLSIKNFGQALETTLLGCKLSKHALSALLKRELEGFDVGVGDSLCQIRANFVIKQLEILDQHEIKLLKSQYQRFYENIKTINNNPGDHKAAAQLSKELRGKTITQFFNNRNTEIPEVTDELRMLMLSHAISQSYNEVGSEVRFDLLKRYGFSLTNNFFKNLIVGIRKELSANTVSYLSMLGDKLMSQAKDFLVDPPQIKRLKFLVDGLSQRAGDRLFSSPPTYFGVALLIEDLRRNKIPVILRSTVICDEGLHKHSVIFIANESGEFSVYNNHVDLTTTGLFVVDGITDLVSGYSDRHIQELQSELDHLKAHSEDCQMFSKFALEFGQLKFEDIFLANAAMHSQFVNKEVEIDFTQIKDLEQEFQDHKKLALEQGFCKENMRLFRIIHIYCATGKHLVEGNC